MTLLAAFLTLSVMLLGLSGCSGADEESPAVGAVTVTGLASDREVEIKDVGAATPIPGLDPVSRVYDLKPDGELGAAVKVHISLERQLRGGTSVVVGTRESAGMDWSYLSATLEKDRRHAAFTTTHFSQFAVLAVDTKVLYKEFRTTFLDAFTAGLTAKAEPPSCLREDDARRDGFQVTSEGPDTIYWCFGIENGKRVLTATNRRGYPLTVQHPNMAVISNPPPDRLAWSNLARLGSGKNFILAPGGSATLNAELQPGQSEGISTNVDATGQTFYAMQTGLTALSSIVTRFGAAPSTNIADIILSNVECVDALNRGWGQAFAQCLSPADVIEAFGTAGVVLAPLMAAAPIAAFFKSQGEAAISQFDGTDDYEVVITRAMQSVSNSQDDSAGTVPLPDDWWELDALCRGAVTPDASTDAACDKRDALTESLARATADRFIAAWQERDESALAAEVTSFDVVTAALQWQLAEDPDPKCDYNPDEPTMYCWVYVTTGGAGFPLQVSPPQPGQALTWKVRGVAPDTGF